MTLPTSSDLDDAGTTVDALMAPRWRGQRGRVEIWYTTLTDPSSGAGIWLHHELLAPADGSHAYAHGLAALFPAAGEPVHRRFGPVAWSGTPGVPFSAGSVQAASLRLSGCAADMTWDLQTVCTAPALFPFPRWAWQRELLPAAQIVPLPTAYYSGSVRCGNDELVLDRAPGATAHIYGRGYGRRWAWLHADLGQGNVLEVVAAVGRGPVLRMLRPLPLIRLRLDGKEHPRGDSLWAARNLKAEITLPTWRVHGRIGDHEIDVVVDQPDERTTAVVLRNPDGSRTLCRNSETATAHITWSANGRVERSWQLEATAHAEVGGY